MTMVSWLSMVVARAQVALERFAKWSRGRESHAKKKRKRNAIKKDQGRVNARRMERCAARDFI